MAIGGSLLTATGRFRVVLDADGMDKEAKKEADKALGRFTDAANTHAAKMGDALKKGLAVGATAAVAGITAMGAASISAASDFDEAKNKLDQVFGAEGAAQIQTFASGAASSMGLSINAANEAAATMGVFGKAAGLTGGQLSGFSTQMVQLAGDLASFHNTSPEQAVQALGAALRGESEPMRAYGVLLDDATLRQEALAQGLIKTTSQALTPQQKTLAAHAVIMKQTADAQGDFARTSDGLANTQRTLAADFDNVKIQVGQGLLPVALSFFTAVKEYGIPAVAGLSSTLMGLGAFIARGDLGRLGQALNIDPNGVAAQALGAFRDAVITIGTAIANNLPLLAQLTAVVLAGVVAWKTYTLVTVTIPTALTAARAAMIGLNAAMAANPIGLVIVALTALAAGLVLAYNKVGWFRDAVDTGMAVVRQAFSKVVDFAQEYLAPGLGVAFEGIKIAFKVLIAYYQFLWEYVWWPIIKVIIAVFKGLGAAVLLALEGIQSGFAATVNGFKTVWDAVGAPVVTTFINAWKTAGNGLAAFGQTARNVWDGIKSTFTSGANAAINVVNGLLKGFNAVAGKLGIPSLPLLGQIAAPATTGRGGSAMHPVRAFASGGPVPGFSPHPKADNILARLTAGEYVLPVAAVKRLGIQALDWLRQGRATIIPTFADGGLVGSLKGLGSQSLEFLTDTLAGASDVKNWLTNGIASLADTGQTFIGEIRNAVLGKVWETIKNAVTGAFTHDDGTATVGPPTAGRVFGYKSQIAWIKSMIPTARITSSIRSGTLGGKSSLASYHNRGRAIDIGGARPGDGPAMARIFRTIAQAFGSSITELIHSPMGGAQIKHGKPYYYTGKTRAIHFDHVHWAMANGGLVRPPRAGLFDSGGLASGTGWMPKNTLAPERVLSPKQTAAFERLVAALERGTTHPGGITINVIDSGDPYATAKAVLRELEAAA